MRHVLIVGNQTLGGRALRSAVGERLAAGPCHFHIVVPATPVHHHLAWTEGEAREVARLRLDRAIEFIAEAGGTASGTVGDASPVLAVTDVLLRGTFDEILVSTLPAGPSRWIRQDLPRRLARRTGLPVHHIVADVREPEVSR